MDDFTREEIQRVVEAHLIQERDYLTQLEQKQHDDPNVHVWEWQRTVRELKKVEDALTRLQAELAAQREAGGENAAGAENGDVP